MIAQTLADAGLAAVAATIFWAIAADAAGRRHLAIGTLPPALPLLVAVAAGAACLIGAQPAAIAALAGIAVAGWVDARTGSIFDPLTIGLLIAAFALAIVQGTVSDSLIGSACVGTALLFLHAVTDGRGIGMGDVKLGFALGMALGTAAGFSAIGSAFVLGALYGTWLLARNRARAETPIRFAPFIAAGTFATILAPIAVRA